MKLYITTLFLLSLLSLPCKVKSQYSSHDTLSLIRQYFECKYLKMYLNPNGGHGPYYIRNGSIPNNQLNDSFYKSKGLDKMTFDQGMTLIRQIYLDTHKKQTYLSNCISWGYIDQFNFNFSVLFRNASNFAGFKTIIAGFNHRHKSSLKRFNDSLKLYPYGSSYPSIVKLLTTNEYSWIKLEFYNRTFIGCSNDNYNERLKLYYSCLYNLIFNNRAVIAQPNNAQLESQMICSLSWYTNCSSLEYQRWNTMIIWINQFPKLKFTGRSLSLYLDKLVHTMRAYKPSLTYQQVYLFTKEHDLYLNSYRSNATRVTLNQTDFKFIALNSSQLRIDSQIKVISQYASSFVWINLTFYLPVGSSPSVLKFNYNTSLNSFKNGTIIKDQKGKNIYQIFSRFLGLDLYDFNSKSKITMNEINLIVTSSTSLLNKANGLLVDGVAASSSGRKKRRDVAINAECETICQQIKNEIPKNNPDGLHISIVEFNRCLDDCSKTN